MDRDFNKPFAPPTNQPPQSDQPAAPAVERSGWQHDVITAMNQTETAPVASVAPVTAPTPAVSVATASPLSQPAGSRLADSTWSAPAPSQAPGHDNAFARIAADPADAVPSWQPSAHFGGYSGSHAEDAPQPPADAEDIAPIAVVEVVSSRGVEYAMMTLTLWLASFSLLGVLLSLINGGTSYSVLAFPASVLLVCLPVFSFFFLRLKKAELHNPNLRFDPSKRRFTQFTQVTAFAACLFTLIAFVYYILSMVSGQGGTSFLKALLNVAAILAVAGGILAYYWVDEHRNRVER